MSEFLVDQLLPCREINLVAGPSGAGKTRWLLNMLKNHWEKGKPFLGFDSYPCKWAYVAADRSLASVSRTMTDLGIDPESLNVIPAWGKDRKTWSQFMDTAHDMGAKLVVVEAFSHFPEELTSHAVKNFLNAAQSSIQKADMTVIGITESPKMKPHDRYENPRQRVSGAAAWAHFTETIFLVEPANVTDPKLPERRLYVCPRNVAGFICDSAFDSTGRLVFDRV